MSVAPTLILTPSQLGQVLKAARQARKLSQAVMRNIRQNLFFAFVYNFLGVPIAMGVLYPFFGTLLGWLGVAVTGGEDGLIVKHRHAKLGTAR